MFFVLLRINKHLIGLISNTFVDKRILVKALRTGVFKYLPVADSVSITVFSVELFIDIDHFGYQINYYLQYSI